MPVYNGYDDAVRCLESLVRHSPNECDILVVDDVGADRRLFDLLATLLNQSGPQVSILQRATNGGFVGACNSAFEAAGQRDVVLVNSDVVVGPQWFERLSEAALSSNVIATASTLTNHGTILSVPQRNAPSPMAPGNLSVDDLATRVAKHSLQLRPTIPTAVGHCTYVKRVALNRVGYFDAAFGRGYGEEVDFSQRAIRAGFRHICADDVFVYHRGGGSFGEVRNELQQQNEKILAARYPYYPRISAVASDDVTSPLALALRRASGAIYGLSVAIDGSCLGPDYMGTQHVVVETVRGLSRSDAVGTITVYVPKSISQSTLGKISGLQKVRIGNCEDSEPEKSDVAYRPYQLTSPREMNRLRSWGHWTVVNQLDVIAFHNPAYFPNAEEWIHYREMTRLILHSVDGVAFISEHARREVNAESLVGAAAAQATIYCGSDFVTPDSSESLSARTGGMPFLFSLGASYLHKSRTFALHLLQGLVNRGWDGLLVLAGPTPPNGNSLGEEAEFLLRHPQITNRVISLGSITDSEKRWLFENASALVYPSVVEGFGFMPFEAAHYDLPAICSRGGSLDEVLPPSFPTFSNFDSGEALDLTWRVLNEPAFGKELVEKIKDWGTRFTWDDTTARLVGLFNDVTTRRPSLTLSVVGERLNSLDLHVRRAEPAPDQPRRQSIGGRHPILKRIVSPDGSHRQRLVRKSINRLRRARTKVRG